MINNKFQNSSTGMRVLMISIDRTLLGADYSGDAVERHKQYAGMAGQLDIVVCSKEGFKKKKLADNLTAYPTNSKNQLHYVSDIYNLAKSIYWPDKFDLIVCQDPFLTGLAGLILKKRFKVPLLVHFHGDFWDNRYWLLEKGRWWFNWFFLLLSKIVVWQADGIRAISSGIRDKIVKKGINQDKIYVIPTPVDLSYFERFDSDRVARLIGKKYKDRKLILNVGRDDGSKDYRTLFRAIELVYADFKKIAFWHVGANLDLISRIKADENLYRRSFGKVSRDKLTNYYNAADIYVSSSCSESFGKVLVEAMAAGKPVVATATTGSKELIKDGVNGFLVPIGDYQALARKILFLLNNPDKAKLMGEQGRRLVYYKFDNKKTMAKINQLWHKLSL